MPLPAVGECCRLDARASVLGARPPRLPRNGQRRSWPVLAGFVCRSDQLDELVDRPVMFLRRWPGVVAHPPQFTRSRAGFPSNDEEQCPNRSGWGSGVDARDSGAVNSSISSVVPTPPRYFCRTARATCCYDVSCSPGGLHQIIASDAPDDAWCFNSSLNRTSASSATWSPNQ
jgi:hypothetical protein